MKANTIRNTGLFFFCLLFVYGLAGYSVFESYEALYPTFFSGVLTGDVPINIWYFVSHFMLSEIYMKFYSIMPAIPCYEIILFFYVAVALFTILFILFKNNAQSGIKAKIVPILLSFILATEFILFFQYTRVAFALGIASTLVLLAGGKENKMMGWWSGVLFVFCLLSRHEVGVFVFLLQWLAVLFVSNRTFSKVALFFNTTVFFLVAGYIGYDRFTTNDFLKQFEPELGYQLLDRGNIVPLSSMTNAIDSAKYIAVTNLITDKEYTTIAFLRSLVAENAFVGVNKELIVRAVNELADKLNHSFGLLIIYIGLLILIIWQTLPTGRAGIAKLLVFNLLFWGILVAVAYFIMLQYYTVDIMLTLICFILLSKIDFGAVHIRYPVAILSGILLLVGVLVLYLNQKEYSQRLTNNLEANVKFRDELKQRYPGKILVPGNDQKRMILFSLHPFEMHNFSSFSRLYMFDADVIYIEPHYNAYLSKECKCDANNYTAFLDFLASKKDSVRIISTPERVEIMKYYCRVVRSKSYDLIPIDSISIDGNNATVFTFK